MNSYFRGLMGLFVGVAISGQALAVDKPGVVVATGAKTGVYYPVGRAICRMAIEGSGVDCRAVSSDGSVVNLLALQKGRVQMAIAQSDWHYHSYTGTSKFRNVGKNEDLRSVFSLHTEPFTVIARADSQIHSFSDLTGKRVNVGVPGSGHRGTMEVAMAIMGWKGNVFSKATELPSQNAADDFCHDQLDALVLTLGHPSSLVSDLAKKCKGQLVNVTNDLINAYVKNRPYYRAVRIPSGTYKGMTRDVRTFGLSATLVASTQVPDRVVHDIVKSIFEDFKKFRNTHRALQGLDEREMMTEALTAPLHPGAVSYYKSKGWM